jgi:hypothetical protein
MLWCSAVQCRSCTVVALVVVEYSGGGARVDEPKGEWSGQSNRQEA